jgi:hypothetical protein
VKRVCTPSSPVRERERDKKIEREREGEREREHRQGIVYGGRERKIER